MRTAWSDRGAGWVENERVFDAVLAPFSEPLLAGVQAGQRVLDIGCGAGALLERLTAVGAAAVGADISDTMGAAAGARVPSATVLLADAQTADLRAHGPFDRVVSRFGVMFFDHPVAAFTNIRSATAAGAHLAMVCWRDAENPMFTLGNSVLTARMADAAVPSASDPVGPLAFGDAGRVQAVLTGAGWHDIRIEPFDGICDYGIDGSDGVEERVAVVLSSSTGRAARAQLAPALGAGGWAALVDDVRAEVRRHLVDGVVKFVGRVWVVTARST